MQSYLDCVPCFVRQALQAARFVTDDVEIHERVVRDVLLTASEMDLSTSPPVMAQHIQRRIRELTGCRDPYREVKQQFNQYALDLLPDLRRRAEQCDDPWEAAIRVAIAGNIIDFGPAAEVTEARVQTAIDESFTMEIDRNQVEAFRSSVEQASTILYLADNAGEIVFDRLLLELIPAEKVVVVVKGGPILNDATRDDAEMAGITEYMEVIDTGSDAPGTILSDCSREFVDRFQAADLIVSKGQANYETLSDVDAEIFFLLKAKCPVIARDMGYDVGDLVVMRGQGKQSFVA